MIKLRPAVFWFLVLAAVVAVVASLRDILLPFVAAMTLAYLVTPLVDLMQKRGISRLAATLGIIGVLVFGIIAVLVAVAPLVVSETIALVEEIPLLLAKLRALAEDPARPWLHKLVGQGLGRAEQSISEFTTLGAAWLENLLFEVWSGGQALISLFSLLVVTPILACYFIYDWHGMIARVEKWVPPARRGTVRTLVAEIDDIFRGFLRGQGTICLIMAAYYAIAFAAIGLNHGVVIGIVVGLVTFIPYLGSITGVAVATCLAIAQFWPNWMLILAIPAVSFVGQNLSDYLLAPHLVGRRVNLGPVWIIFALFAFGNLFGVVGLLIAVPVAAAIGVLIRFAQNLYFTSSFYEEKPAMSATVLRNPTHLNLLRDDQE
jgi:predicted PurR-regulated permease PerM